METVPYSSSGLKYPGLGLRFGDRGRRYTFCIYVAKDFLMASSIIVAISFSVSGVVIGFAVISSHWVIFLGLLDGEDSGMMGLCSC